MEQEERYSIIASILKLLKEKRSYQGKLATQKLLYFLKEAYGVSLSYEFYFYHYGPYSKDLDKDLRNMEMFNIISIKEDPLKMGYSIELNQDRQVDEYINKGNRLVENYKEKIKEVLKLFGELPPEDLELLATIHYVYKDVKDTSYTKNSIVQTVKNLKPKYEISEIDSYYDYLIANKLIKG